MTASDDKSTSALGRREWRRIFFRSLLCVVFLGTATNLLADTALTNGVSLGNLSGAQGGNAYFQITVPSGQSTLIFRISGGTGDCDMYVRRGSQPTTTTFDYRPYLGGNDETVTVTNPAAGTWFIMLRGYSAYSGVTLVASFSGGLVPTVLSNNTPVTGIAGATASERLYRIAVPTSQSNLEFRISGGTGDCDLYVKRASAPSTTSYDFRPYLGGNDETVSISSPAAGDWYVLLRGYSAYSGVTLVARFSASPSAAQLGNNVLKPNLSGAVGSERLFSIVVPTTATRLRIQIFGGSGDCDLYVKRGSPPSASTFDFRPYLGGSDETVMVESVASGTWYVMLRGYSAYSGVTLFGRHSVVDTGFVVPLDGFSFTNDGDLIPDSWGWFWNLLDNSSGSCLGMSAFAGGWYEGRVHGQSNPTHLSSLTLPPDIPGRTQLAMELWNADLALEESIQSAIWSTSDEVAIGNIVGSMRSQGWPVVVGMKPASGMGHAVLAYLVEETPDMITIHVYDPNYPGNAGGRIHYYKSTRQATYNMDLSHERFLRLDYPLF